MTTVYFALVETKTTAGRLANLTQTPGTLAANKIDPVARTKTALTGTVYWTNLDTGVYLISVADALDGLAVYFRILVHADDQATFADCAALHMREIEASMVTIDTNVDSILEDTGTTLPASIAAISTWVATNVSASVTAGAITQTRGDDWSIAITDVTLGAGKKQFAIKRNDNYEDTDSYLLIDSTTGLLYYNGTAAADATKASLDYTGTTLTVVVDAIITAQLAPGAWHYGIQSLDGSGNVTEAYGGTFTITADIVRAVA